VQGELTDKAVIEHASSGAEVVNIVRRLVI